MDLKNISRKNGYSTSFNGKYTVTATFGIILKETFGVVLPHLIDKTFLRIRNKL